MTIGTIGTGRIAAQLAFLWAAKGHAVMLGSRDPAAARGRIERGDPRIRVGTIPEAAAFGYVVLLAVPWGAVEESLRAAGPVSGKTLIDCVNPIVRDENGMRLALGCDTSASEQIAAWSPGSHVVKAFNSIYWENLARPVFGHEAATCFYCGDDAASKSTVRQLIDDIGFDPVDAGPLSAARLLEPLALLWIQLASERGLGNNIAIKLISR